MTKLQTDKKYVLISFEYTSLLGSGAKWSLCWTAHACSTPQHPATATPLSVEVQPLFEKSIDALEPAKSYLSILDPCCNPHFNIAIKVARAV